MVRHLWGVIAALGLFVLVGSGTWSCLTATSDPQAASTSRIIALCGCFALVAGLLARGESSAAIAKVRRVLGGLGLVVAPVAGVLTLLALSTDPSAALGFLLLTFVALAAWAQGVSAQVGLSFRVVVVWLGVLALIIVPVMAVATLAAGVLGRTPRAGARPAFGSAGRAVTRMALGRATQGDVELLAAGPGSILRRRSVAMEDRAAADGRLAAADARLAAGDMQRRDRDDGPTDQADR